MRGLWHEIERRNTWTPRRRDHSQGDAIFADRGSLNYSIFSFAAQSTNCLTQRCAKNKWRRVQMLTSTLAILTTAEFLDTRRSKASFSAKQNSTSKTATIIYERLILCRSNSNWKESRITNQTCMHHSEIFQFIGYCLVQHSRPLTAQKIVVGKTCEVRHLLLLLLSLSWKTHTTSACY